MREGVESIGSGQVQIQEQQIHARMLIESVEEAADAVGLENLDVHASRRDGAVERQAIQRMVINDEYFVVHALSAIWIMRPRHVAPAAGMRTAKLAAPPVAKACAGGGIPHCARPRSSRHRDRR